MRLLGCFYGKDLAQKQTNLFLDNLTLVIISTYTTYEDGTDSVFSSEPSAHKIQMPGNHPEQSIQHSEHGKSLKPGLEDVQQTIS
jgi:hypothetical protein